MRFKSVDSIERHHVGQRVTVRRRLPEGGSGDVVGVLEDVDAASVAVRDRNGEHHRIERSDIVAARVIPAPEKTYPGQDAPG